METEWADGSQSSTLHSFADTTVAKVKPTLQVNTASLSKLTHILVMCITHHTLKGEYSLLVF